MWFRSIWVISAFSAVVSGSPQNPPRSNDIFFPTGLATGKSPTSETSPFTSFSLTPSSRLATLDYGSEVSGYPFFGVTQLSGKVQIEVKYTEEYAGLLSPFSDGPWVYSIGLSNTFRVETFEVTEIGELEAFLLQGGQRWQSIKLLTSGSITFGEVGYKASVDNVDLDNLPGSFKSESKLFNDIWNLGAQAVSRACVSAGSQRAIWEISHENGAFVRGMRVAQSVKSQNFSDYTLTFSSKIVRGGTGWAMAFPLSSRTGGLQFNIIGELPESTTFVNTDRMLTPPNTLVVGYGWNPFVNQTTLQSYRLADFSIPFAVRENQWYKISTSLRGKSLRVSIDDKTIIDTSLSQYWLPATISQLKTLSSGAFGFGGYQDQAAYIKDVTVTDKNGSNLYTNPMTAPSVLVEYGVHSNPSSVCLDGPKRDRLVWLGDFFHTSRIIGASTIRWDFALGTLRDSLSWQSPTTNLLPISQNLGYESSSKYLAPASAKGYLGLADYQLLGFMAFYTYVQETNDLAFVRETWSQWQGQLEFLIGGVNSSTGLYDIPGTSAFIGPTLGGSAVGCAMVQTLSQASELAAAINDTSSATRYSKLAESLSENINSKLWNENLGVYSLSLSDPGNFSVSGISFAITSGVASKTRATRSIARISDLKLGPGYKDSSLISSADPTANISPNTNGFLLTALMQSNSSSLASELIKSLWGAMLSNATTTTGASWEYVDQDGQPGLGLFTSLSHPWGGAATYVLTKEVAGIQPVAFGYSEWVIRPNLAFGLNEVRCGVATPFGKLAVEYEVWGKQLNVRIQAPEGTSGQFILDQGVDGKEKINGGISRVKIMGGTTRVFVVDI